MLLFKVPLRAFPRRAYACDTTQRDHSIRSTPLRISLLENLLVGDTLYWPIMELFRDWLIQYQHTKSLSGQISGKYCGREKRRTEYSY